MTTGALSLRDLKQLIIDSLQLDGMTPDSIADDEPLFGDGVGLDSVDALELIVALEKRLATRIRPHEIEADTLRSAAAMHRFITNRLAGGDGAG